MKFLKPTSKVMLVIVLSFLGHVVAHGQTTNSQRSNAQKQRKSKKERLYDNAIERFNFEYNKIKDPRTGKVPDDIRRKELKFSRKIRVKKSFSRSTSKSKEFSDWKSRGPFNVGGRTRALAIDITNENIIFAGGVSGGLWKTVDKGQSWSRILQGDQDLNITTIVQDPREGMRNVWYYGAGEVRGNTANALGASISGNGIYKSVDGGNTWQLLASTADGDITQSNAFGVVNSMVVNPVNGDVYVAGKKGIYRSQDAGVTFAPVLGTTNDISFSEIAVTSTGRLYATIDGQGDPVKGFFTSATGNATEWTDFTPIPNATYRRTVIGIDPSNENRVYFLSFHGNQGQGAQPLENSATLFRYDHGDLPRLANLSSNLPTGIGTRIANLNFQGSYNMLIKVHPTNPNIVFIGGTNLYRSFDGFTTPFPNVAQEVQNWIGGYKPNQTGDVDIYTNHYADQHNLLFFPSNPNMALSGNDGGVFITNDITRVAANESVNWTSLNNGYQTTQVYDLSFDPQATNEHILSGFQDNGTYFTSSSVPTTIWGKASGGDGGVNHIADNGNTRYVSSQYGSIRRQNISPTGEVTSRIIITPEGTSNSPGTFYSFLTPYILDHNNDNIMYLGVANAIWRNNNLDEIPFDPEFKNASVNWTVLFESLSPSGSNISTMDVSTYPVANRLYYGSTVGEIFRIDNANLDNQEVVDIFTGKNFIPGSNVTDIAVDPSNSDRVIVVFSNYNIPSIFMSNDAGNTWQDISGNLEENVDGTGNGPSVRSVAFYEGNQVEDRLQKVYVGTSTGLYYTTGDLLARGKVKWTREDIVIGEALVEDIDIRKDGFIAVGTHGSGVYSAKFPLSQPLPQPKLSVTRLLEDFTVVENSADTLVNTDSLFRHTDLNPIAIEITNSNPGLVTATLNNGVVTLVYTPNTTGRATIGLIATSGTEQVSEGFTVTVDEAPIYSQLEGATENGYPIYINPEQQGQLIQFVAADDFIVPEGETWTIDRIKAFGFGENDALIVGTNVLLALFNNDSIDLDQNIIYQEQPFQTLNPVNPYNNDIDISFAPQVLPAGRYWISVSPIIEDTGTLPEQKRWNWLYQIKNPGVGERAQIVSTLGGVYSGWSPIQIDENDPLDPGIDLRFQIFGSVAPAVPNPPVNTASKKTIVSPNPSSGIFTFHLENVKGNGNISISIHDFWGRQVYSKSNIDKSSNFEWDASHMSQGIYFVKIVRGETTEKLKIIKK
ncbi:T9SS type A sorting domain-containing protein [Aquimarina sp. I32.4]|uniref:T9SS type A sorting domain-containing protein n=1 Tax=Aquimarina sp. I32.4 TaxID=2053903 RepID=UPI000CDEC5D2|nr:T9SS type A sorting domain-containing protein [Aquimarina sp. I32.4]